MWSRIVSFLRDYFFPDPNRVKYIKNQPRHDEINWNVPHAEAAFLGNCARLKTGQIVRWGKRGNKTQTGFLGKVHNTQVEWLTWANPISLDLSALPASSPQSQHVFLYTVGKTAISVNHAAFRGIIPACPEGTEYIYVTSFPEKVFSANYSGVEFRPIADKGINVVLDIIRPGSLSYDLDADDKSGLSSGTNLSLKGVFYSYSNPPKREEIDAAARRMRSYYTAVALAYNETPDKPKFVANLLDQNDLRIAQKYFN